MRAEKLSESVDASYFNRIKKANLGMRLRSLDKVKSLCHEQADAVFAGYDYLDTIEIINEIEADEISSFIRKTFREENTALSVIDSK